MTGSIPIDLPPTDVLDDLCRRYGIKELALFGSVMRDDFRSDSDIDVLVEFKPGVRNGLFTFVRLQHELEAILGRSVDLVPKDGLKPIIRDHVISSSQVIRNRGEVCMSPVGAMRCIARVRTRLCDEGNREVFNTISYYLCDLSICTFRKCSKRSMILPHSLRVRISTAFWGINRLGML